ncbi:MAG: tetratricopeptide repeat protein [Candidatus Cloacimonadales bacterium]
MKKISIILLLIIISAVSWASPEITLQNAFSAYQNQDYSEALELFLQVENEGFINADLYYNIGNSYYRNNDLGKAILYMKKALKIDSAHAKAQRSLEFLLTQTRNKQSAEADNLLVKFTSDFINSISVNLLAILALLLSSLIIFTIHIIIHRYARRERAVPYFFITILIALLIPVLLLSQLKLARRNAADEAVLLADTAIGYSGPSPDFTRVFTIHEGIILEVERQQDNWTLVKLPNGIGGWITSESLAKTTIK